MDGWMTMMLMMKLLSHLTTQFILITLLLVYMRIRLLTKNFNPLHNYYKLSYHQFNNLNRLQFSSKFSDVINKRRMSTKGLGGEVEKWGGKYPEVRREEEDKIKEGERVADPYRWLEVPDSEETKSFVTQQVKLTEGYLANYPEVKELSDRVRKYYDFPKLSVPSRRGDYYYYFYNPGLLPQSILYQLKSLDSEPIEFFNPNKLSEDGTVSLSSYSFSKDGQYFAYGTSRSGSDWVTVQVLPVKEGGGGEPLEEKLEWVKFSSLSWTKDNKGFFYSRYPSTESMDEAAGTETQTNQGHRAYYHRVGTPQSEDIFIYQDNTNPDHLVSAYPSYDSQWLFIELSESCDPVNKLYVTKLHNGNVNEIDLTNFDFEKEKFIKLVDDFKAGYDYITNDGPIIYFKTNLNSPKYRIVKVDLNNLDDGFIEVIPETSALLESVACVGNDKLLLVYLENVTNQLQLYNLSGQHLQGFQHELGSIYSVSGKREETEVFFYLAGFLNPGIIYQIDLASDSNPCTIWRKTEFQDPKLADYITTHFQSEQIWYDSSDGTRIPMFLVRKKGKSVPSNQPRPTLLYGYGGFSISITPMFSPFWLSFMDTFDGNLAIANIRGGNEFGEEWHRQGILEKKQQGLTDFQYAAKHLISESITTPEMLVINGGSNGGLLVGASVTQAPELFGCAIADVGVLDMLRFHKFTIGHAWKSDYGDPDNPDHFKFIIKYSPLHNVRPWSERKYPPTLLATGDHDDRVSPLHTFKFLATLQHYQRGSGVPMLGRIETKAGHGAGKPIQKKIEEAVDKLRFIALSLKLAPSKL